MNNKQAISTAKSKLANIIGSGKIMESTTSTVTQPNGVTMSTVRLLTRGEAISCRMWAGRNEYFGNEEFGAEDKNGFYKKSLSDVRRMFGVA